MTTQPNIRRVKAGITARGFITAVKDYTEPAVVEELCANSYDADATTVLVLLDPSRQQLHIFDDGTGFTKQAIETAAVLGGGDKREVDYSYSKRPYLGAYGFGLKSSVKIANKVTIHSISKDGEFKIEIDWRQLEEALKTDSLGFELTEKPARKDSKSGTHIMLDLKNPTSDILDDYHKVLGNLPGDSGKCKYYTGFMPKVRRQIGPTFTSFGRLKSISRDLVKHKLINYVNPSEDPDLRGCIPYDLQDKQDPDVKCRIYFAGMDGDKVRQLKKGLRGIYVRIQGRLLKQSFDDQKYVYGISKWVKFASSLRAELTIDWLRNEISLSREGLTFSNPKLEEQFRTTLSRNISAFIAPQLTALQKRAQKHTTRRQKQRMELARSRSSKQNSRIIKSIKGSFNFKPETDGELALIVANNGVLSRVNPAYRLLDYNDKAPFDCIFFDSSIRDFVFCELEPTLIEFLQHKQTPEELKLIITWTLGKWRMGARMKGLKATYELNESNPKKKGHYRLLAFKQLNSKNAFADYEVVALEEILNVQNSS